MISSRRLQRGAVTLLGALFIVIVLSVMAIALLRMAGSNTLDSAVQNDAVEALFVAETGIEYASSVYASSSSCIGLSDWPGECGTRELFTRQCRGTTRR